MAVEDLLPYLYSSAEHQQERRDQWWDAQRKQRIADHMATANQIKRQLDYANNLTHAIALATNIDTHTPLPGHEEEVARYQSLLKQYNVPELNANLTQMEGFIQKLYDPNFNPQTGMEQRSPIRALGEKLHLVKPQTTPLAQPQAGQQPQPWPPNMNMATGLPNVAPQQPPPKPKTAGEIIRGLKDIQQKYDIAPPGLEEGEKELAGAEQQREQEQTQERRMDFIAEQGKKRGWSEEEIQAIQQAGAGGYKPTAPKPSRVKAVYQDQTGKQYQEFDDGTIATLGGDKVPKDVLNALQLTPLSKGGAANLKLGTFPYFLNSAYGPSPTPQQQADARRIWAESAAIERQTDGTIRWIDKDNNVWEIPETHTTRPVPSGLTPPAPYQAAPTPGPIQIGVGGQTFKGQQGAGAPVVESVVPTGTPQITPGRTSATGATDVTVAPQSSGGGAATTGGAAAPTPPVPGAKLIGKGKPTPPQVKAQEDYNAAIGLQTQANQVAEHMRQGLPAAVEQHRVVIALERQSAGRFTQQAANYMVTAGLANSIEQAMNQLTGGGELPADVWQQLLRAIDDYRAGAAATLKSSGLDVPKTTEEQQDEELFQKLNRALEEANKQRK